jgi:predicted transcriptional regulator
MTPNDFKHFRLKNRLTQEELAGMLDISTGCVSHYETGRQPIPRVVSLAIRFLNLDMAMGSRFIKKYRTVKE